MHQHRPRICWITPDYFSNVDAKIVPHLLGRYSIDWLLVRPFQSERTADGLVTDAIKPREVRLTRRQRDPRIITQYVKIAAEIRRNNYDLVYTSFHGLPYFFPVMASLLDLEKVIYAVHNVSTPKGASNEAAMRIYQRFAFAVSKRFQVFSKYQHRTIAALLPGKRHYYAPLGPDNYGPSVVQPPEDRIRFLFFGYIRPYKRLDLLLEAFRTLHREGIRHIELVIAGRCDDWETYARLIDSEMRVDARIEMIANSEIADIVSSCHYAVLPYQDSAQSGVLSLAYHYHKPVITSDIEGLTDDVVPGHTGYIFKNSSRESLVSVIRDVVLRHHSDYQRLTHNVCEYVKKHHSLETIVSQYETFIDDALEATRRQPTLLRLPPSV